MSGNLVVVVTGSYAQSCNHGQATRRDLLGDLTAGEASRPAINIDRDPGNACPHCDPQ